MSRARRFFRVSALAALLPLLHGAGAQAAPRLEVRSGALGARQPGTSDESAARSVLGQQLPSSRGLSFGAARVTELSRGDRIVKLPQTHMGLPIAHRGASVTFLAGVARHVSARLETRLPDDVTPALGRGDAAALAEARTGLATEDEQLGLWPTPGGVRLVWATVGSLPGLPYQPVTVIDAKTGEVVYFYNAVRELNQAMVYPTNPVKSPGLLGVTLPVGAGETALTNSLVTSANCIDQQTVKNIDVGFPLTVHVCDLIQTATPDANGDYLDPAATDKAPEDSFSEISIFYHTNRAYDLFRGWSPNLKVNGSGPIQTVSNLRIPQGFDTFDLAKLANPNLPLAPFQNAFFSPGDPLFSALFGTNGATMWFGQGPLKDYSYDGDVVYHELTHGAVDATLKLVGTPVMDEYGASHAPGAMNEGLADYFSSVLTGDPDVGEYASQDFASGSTSIRSLTDADSCPSAVGGEVHQDATLFSGALWDVRVTLSPADQAKLDESVFEAMNVSPTGELTYDELAELIVAQAEAILGVPGAQALTAAFTARGVLPKCTRVLEVAEGQTLQGPAKLLGRWMALGTLTTGVTHADGWTPGIVQFHQALPANAVKLDVSMRKVMVGANPFGGGGTPFEPKFLVRFSSDPITFTYGPTATNADVVAVDGVPAGATYTASVDVPPGSTDVHVMIGSVGQSDGAFTDVELIPTLGEPVGGGGGMGGGGSGGSGGSGGVVVESGGCGCAVPQSSGSTELTLSALAALGLLASRRRSTRAPLAPGRRR